MIIVKGVSYMQDDELNSENNLHFEKLTPTDNADIKGYNEALNYIFDNSDIKNVAISGAYSAGKSSILATYKKSHNYLKFIHISLAHFKPLDKDKTKNNEKVDDNDKDNENNNENEDRVKESTLEGKILNQLIHQIPSDKIPLTNFQIKNKTNSLIIFGQTLTFIVFLIAIIHFFYFDIFKDYMVSLNIEWLIKLLNIYINKLSLILDFLYIVIFTSIVLYKTIKIELNRNIFHKFNIQGNEIEIFEDNDDSYFDKYLNEILYLFENSNADVIVFEDMDRFNSHKIFERLHEVNTLANIQLNKEDKKILRFFYLLRDDIFISKDRTKFFDYIIPVIPVIDSSNSYDKFITILKKNNIFEKFDESFLQGLSLYIDDMRILKNIYNEFTIYYNRLNNIELDSNKMLAIITYKNLFPRDFSELQLNKGFVYTIFFNKNTFIENEIKVIKQKILDKVEEINLTNNEHLESINEIELVYKEKFRYNRLKEDLIKYEKRKKAIENRLNKKIPDLEKDKTDLEQKLISISNKQLHEIINRNNIDDIFNISKINNIGQKNDFNEIKGSEYFDLLKYLIRNGYIDETYSDYMTYFYDNSLSKNDKIFLRSITDKKAKSFDYKLDNLQLVVSRLRLVDFDQVETLNFQLLDYLLHNNKEDFIKRLINQLKETKNYDFFSKYFDVTKELPRYVKYLNMVWSELFDLTIKEKILAENQIRDYSIYTLYYSDDEILKSINKDGCLCDYISNSIDYLSIENPNVDRLIHCFELLKVKFIGFDYDKSDKKLLQAVYEKSLYKITADNLKLFMSKMLKIDNQEDILHKNYSIVSSYPESEINIYIHQNINDYFDVVIEMSNQNINDDENIVVDILNNSELTIEHKTSYISVLKTKVSSIEQITDKNLWNLLLEKDVVEYSEQNIIDCFKYMKLSENLISLINRSNTKLDFSKLSVDEKLKEGLFDSVIICKSINNDKYKQLLESNSFYYDENFNIKNIDDDKFIILVDIEIIDMSISNLKFIRENYPKQKNYFINKNIEKYIAIISNNSFLKEELLDILTSNCDEELKIKLLDKFSNKPISMSNKKYSPRISLYILEHNLEENDLNDLFSSFDQWDDSIQEKIFNLALQYFDRIINKPEFVSENLIDKLFYSNDLQRENKINLFVAKMLKTNDEKLKNLLTLLELPKFIRIIETPKSNPEFEINDENTKLLNAFKEKGLIKSYEKIPDKDGYFKVKR